eukprot:TRINITY_DN10418_c0_g1_i1.p1 TRINITY_DN10418_c0_g1~~TRINITY_DN10418_c0_g1_i1.p1  ORF type:complete len:779 (+),score=142.10 TRINITY_DN10418_c0_g1_i1:178-2514(+)
MGCGPSAAKKQDDKSPHRDGRKRNSSASSVGPQLSGLPNTNSSQEQPLGGGQGAAGGLGLLEIPTMLESTVAFHSGLVPGEKASGKQKEAALVKKAREEVKLSRVRPDCMDDIPNSDIFTVLVSSAVERMHSRRLPVCAKRMRELGERLQKALREEHGSGDTVPRGAMLAQLEQALSADPPVALDDGSSTPGRSFSRRSGSSPAYAPMGPLVVRAADQGSRKYMEDLTFAVRDLGTLYGVTDCAGPDLWCAVYDGHAGISAAEWARERLHGYTAASEHYTKGDLPEALRDGFRKCDSSFAALAQKAECDAGSCVAAVLLRGNTLWCAHCGDCQAVLCRGEAGSSPSLRSTSGSDSSFRAVTLCAPHNLDRKEERAAVEARGGRLEYHDGCLRVNGVIPVTRSIGDRTVRTVLSQEPEVAEFAVDWDHDEFVICGSDGLFGAMSVTELCEFVRAAKAEVDDVFEARRQLVRRTRRAQSGRTHSGEGLQKASSFGRRNVPQVVSPGQRSLPQSSRMGSQRGRPVPRVMADRTRQSSHSPSMGASAAMAQAENSCWSLFSVQGDGDGKTGASDPSDDDGVPAVVQSLRRLRRAFHRQVGIRKKLQQGQGPPIASPGRSQKGADESTAAVAAQSTAALLGGRQGTDALLSAPPAGGVGRQGSGSDWTAGPGAATPDLMSMTGAGDGILGNSGWAGAGLPEPLAMSCALDEDWDELLEDIAHRDLDFHDYQIVAEALVGHVVNSHPKTCDNVSCAILFLHPQHLGPNEAEHFRLLCTEGRCAL